jgi:aminoglycoside 6'-N-acetyltransferase I
VVRSTWNAGRGSLLRIIADHIAILSYILRPTFHIPSLMINIHPVAPADIDQWITLRIQLWPEESPEELAAEAVAFFITGVLHLEEVLVAEHSSDGVIGFAELSLRRYAEGCTTSPVAFLEGWIVAPEHRGKGVGAALVKGAEAWGRSQGCHELASDTTVDNSVSAAAHQALGFEEVEVIRCFRKSLEDGRG